MCRLLLFFVVSAVISCVINAAANTTSWVIFQGFNWDTLSNRGSLYSELASMAPSLASAGIDAVWFPPVSQSIDPQGYLPQQWYSLVSESNLVSALSAVTGNKMAAIADIVINHRTAPSVDSCTKHYTSFSNPSWGSWSVASNDENCVGVTSCCGAADTGEGLTYAPDLDHTNAQVQADVKSFLSFLKGYKFSGWRFDFVKGYAPSYVASYLSASSPDFSVGEYWDGSTSLVENWIVGTGGKSQAFDFPLRYILQAAIKANNFGTLGYQVPGVVGIDPTHAVTFLDNHDTSRDDRFGSTDQLIMGYAYILTHPGTPCVFYTDWKVSNIQTAITKLIAVRASQGITATSSVVIDKYTSGLYAAYVNNNLAVKLGTGSWSPPDSSYVLYTSGNNYAVWKK